MRIATVLVSAVLLLSGCGGGDEGPVNSATPIGTTQQAPAVTAEPTAEPTAEEPSRAEAGANYTRLVAPSNRSGKAVKDFGDTVGASLSTSDLATWRRLFGGWADDLRAFSLGLQQQRWPVAVQPQIDALVLDVIALQVGARAMSKAQDQEEFLGAVNDLPSNTGAGEAVRQKLGLPETPA